MAITYTMTGTWAVVTFAGDVATTHLTGALSKGATIGAFYGHIGSTQMKTLLPGKYTVVCQAICASVDYEQEFAHEPLTIKGAGILA